MKVSKKKTIFVGMSGGVDSSVAAALLRYATAENFQKLFERPTPKGFRGYNVVGIHLRCFNVDGCAERDAEDARKVAGVLGIPFYVLDFEKEYKERVVEYMIEGYRTGITPNPDVMCNKEIKFGLFLERALAMGADYVATGHYVKLQKSMRKSQDGRSESKNVYTLGQAKDKNKDQSYFLWTLTQDQLRHCLFPIGDYLKTEVRALARRFGLLVAEKKDSQGICFLGKITLSDFLKEYIPERPGMVFDIKGEKVGSHDGAYFYTIGQRHGLHLGSHQKGVTHSARYVVEKDIEKNTVVVAEGEDSLGSSKKEIILKEVHFINPEYSRILTNKRITDFEVDVRIRYRQPLVKAKLIFPRESASPSASVRLLFEQAQKAVAPGQSAVFYRSNPSTNSGSKSRDSEMLGGGVIGG